MCASAEFAGFDGHVIIMCGDSPLFTAGTVWALMNRHIETSAVITLVSAVLGDPTGYGRIIRRASGEIERIVEERCAGDDERTIEEVNGGAYAFDADWLYTRIGAMAVNEAGEVQLD